MRSVPHRVVCLLGLDDGAFPRKAPRDGDDLMLERPARRRARPAQRGPPAAARRAAGRDRPPDRHLHRQRRAHQRRRARRRCRSASCSTSIDATVRADGGRRASRSWSAIRCSRSTRATSTPGALVADAHLELRPRRRSTGARALVGPRAQRRPVPARAAAAALDGAWSSSTTSCASSSTRCGRSCASGSASASADDADEIEDALPVELDGLRALGRRPAAARGAARRRRRPHARSLAEIARGTLPPGVARASR